MTLIRETQYGRVFRLPDGREVYVPKAHPDPREAVRAISVKEAEG